MDANVDVETDGSVMVDKTLGLELGDEDIPRFSSSDALDAAVKTNLE